MALTGPKLRPYWPVTVTICIHSICVESEVHKKYSYCGCNLLFHYKVKANQADDIDMRISNAGLFQRIIDLTFISYALTLYQLLAPGENNHLVIFSRPEHNVKGMAVLTFSLCSH